MELGFLRGGGVLRLLGDFEDHFAGARQAHLFASDAFDGLGVGAQSLNLLIEMSVLLIQPVDLSAQFLHLRLRATHGEQAVTSENVVNGQKKEREAQNCAGVAAPKRLRLLRIGLSQPLAPCRCGKKPLASGFRKARRFFQRGTFRVDAHQRLGPGEAQQDPGVVIENKF